MKTNITKITADWIDVKNKCRNTVNKKYSDKEATSEFKKKLLISEHSPIRLIKISWRWEGIKSWISVHFARHWLGWDKWISTQRSDRTGKDRDKAPQDTLVNYDGEANAQACINVAKFRLCYRAHPETRAYMEDFKVALKKNEKELSDVLVPQCIYRCGCSEFKSCGYIKSFREWILENSIDIDWFDIQQRYNYYNQYFYETYKKGMSIKK